MENIAKIAIFNIVSESGVAAGIRRIEAQTGYTAYESFFNYEKIARKSAKVLKTDIESLEERVKSTLDQLKNSEKEIEKLKSKLASYEADSMFDSLEEINGIKVLMKTFKGKDAEYLREIVDKAKDKLGSCIVVLGSDIEKAVFAVGVTKDLITKVKAGDLVREAAKLTGGNGGGRPDFAQAGGKDGSQVENAINLLRDILKQSL